MKLGRNDPCPCGSGKKYKRCCMDSASKRSAEIFDEVEQTVAMNPDISMAELNAVMQSKAQQRNQQGVDDFCGLSPEQMSNWLYDPLSELSGVSISTPPDFSSSPVMRYLQVMVEEAMQQGGSFKATARGNLPTKVVKQASALLPEFAVAKFDTDVSISAYAGATEDKVEALNYTRLLAEVAGLFYLRSGRFHLKKAAQKQFQTHGMSAFFMPMLEAAIKEFNWGYFDAFEAAADLQMFALFMLWRFQTHGSAEQLTEEVATAFPALVQQIQPTEYHSANDLLEIVIESRFFTRFLEVWGFVLIDPKRYVDLKKLPLQVAIQPLMQHTFQFNIAST